MERIELTGYELTDFLRRLTEAGPEISLLRLWWDGGLKYKIDGGMWSPPLGVIRDEEY